MNIEIKELLQGDFEKYMASFFTINKRFSLEDFGLFAATILNHYVSNQVIPLSNKKEGAYFLISLYNKGIGNRIIEDHLQMISQAISNDSTVDFGVIGLLFS